MCAHTRRCASLDHLPDVEHDFLGDVVGHAVGHRFGVDAEDGLCVGAAHVYPAVLEIDAHTIYRIHLIVSVFLGNLCQDSLQVNGAVQFGFLLHDAVVGIEGADLAATLSAFGHVGQEEGDAHERVATVVQLRIDDTSVALAANHSVGLLHHLHHVHLAHCGRGVRHSVLVGYVLQGTGG